MIVRAFVYRVSYSYYMHNLQNNKKIDQWLSVWEERTIPSGRIVASEEEALCALLELERIMRREIEN